MSDLVDKLDALGACAASQGWVEGGGYETIEAAWADVSRPEWMLWLLYALDPVAALQAIDALFERIVFGDAFVWRDAHRDAARSAWYRFKEGRGVEPPEVAQNSCDRFLQCLGRREKIRTEADASYVFWPFLVAFPTHHTPRFAALVRAVVGADRVGVLWRQRFP